MFVPKPWDATERNALLSIAPASGTSSCVLHRASSPSQDLPLYEHLKHILPALGVAVFVHDRRGSGASGDDEAQAGTEIAKLNTGKATKFTFRVQQGLAKS